MILELTFGNYRLFKNDNVLSFRADKRTKRLLSNSVSVEGASVLKALAVYGANNAGKTNVVAFLEMLKSILEGKSDIVCNSDLFGDDGPTSFSIVFDNQDGKGWLRYEGSYDSKDKRFLYERLSSIRYYRTSTRAKVIFERDFSAKRLVVLAGDKSSFLDILPSSRPFLSTIAVDKGPFSALKDWKESLKRCADFIVPIRLYNIPLEHTIGYLKSRDPAKCGFIKSFIKAADISVDDIGYGEAPPPNMTIQAIQEGTLSPFEGQIDAFKVMTSYGTHDVPSLLYDSSGTKKIEALASYVYDAVTEGKLLVIDELDNGLHYNLVRAIVSLFNSLANTRGQILFTGHDLLLIEVKNLLRKEQVYFLFREKNVANLTCLSSFKANAQHVREGSSFIKRYARGNFGKAPSPSFVKELLPFLEKKEA